MKRNNNKHLEVNALFDAFQSACRPAHSCETALVRIQDDILQSLDNRKSTILVILDIRAAFDTVDNEILLDRLPMFGIRGNAQMDAVVPFSTIASGRHS